MAKTTKRREWTKDDVRELKTLARQKTPVTKIAKALKRTRRRNAAEGVHARRVIGLKAIAPGPFDSLDDGRRSLIIR